ncbi:MAG: type II secretion system protein [Firmicutes bacterium]|nr:type II secretion system protein [Bacillota bacterium]
MRKNGFTLIELLAVIVVLAVIALIAIPVVMDAISNAEKGAAERSAENYASAVERLIATERLDGNIIQDGTYEINSDGNLVINGVVKVIEMSGKKPNGGTITVSNGVIAKESTTTITVGNYDVTYNAEGKTVINEKETVVQTIGYDQSCKLISGKLYEVGSKYTCKFIGNNETEIELDFYFLEDDYEFGAVNLISADTFGADTMEFYEAYVYAGSDFAVEHGIIGSFSLPTYAQLYAVNKSETIPSWLYGNYWLASDGGVDVYSVFGDTIIVEAESAGVRVVYNLSLV